MGQVADDIIAGLLCEQCGSYIDGDMPGYPRSCDDCEEEGN